MKIGVTGASGFIGKRIVEMGLDRGLEMVAYIRNPSKFGKELLSKVKVFEGDLSNVEDSKKFVDYCDVIIHTAALVSDWGEKSDYQKITVDGTQALLDQMVGTTKKIVLASSVAVYTSNIPKGVCTEDMAFEAPNGNYSWAKQEQEKLVKKYAAKHHITFSIIRPSNIFGPGSPSWVDEYIAAMKQGPMLINGGLHHGLTYIDNVADMFLLAATNPKANGQIYNGSDDEAISWKDYAEQIASTLSLPKPKSLPLGLAKIVSVVVPAIYKLIGKKDRPPLTKEALNFVAYPYKMPYAKAQKELGYSPKVNIDEAMKRTLKYVKENF